MPSRRTLRVTGMACDGCERTVESALSSIDGVRRVKADHEGETVEVVAEDDIADDDLEAAITDAGYEAVA